MSDRVDAKPAVPARDRLRPRRLAGAMALALTLSAGLVAAGCGSSSSSSSTATKPALTKAAFLAQGNAICTDGNKKLEVFEKRLQGGPTQAELKTFVTGPFASEVQRQINAVRALGAPSGDQATVTHMLDLAQADLDRVKANTKLLESRTASPFHDFSTLAHAYGLTACSEEN